MRFGLLWLVALMGAGCVGDGDKRLIDQTRQAGGIIEADEALPPATRAIGSDVRQNSEQLQASLGAPEVSEPYSATASADARAQSQREKSAPPGWLSGIVSLASPWAPWAGGALAAVWGVVSSLGRRNTVKKLKAVYDGVNAVKDEVGNGQYAEAVTDVMREVAGLHGVYKEIKADLSEMRK